MAVDQHSTENLFWKTFKNHKSLKEVMESFFNIKNFKSGKKMMWPFKSHKKVIESFFGVKNCKTVMVSFFSNKNFESHKKVTKSFFSDHASLYFYDEFPRPISSLSV